MFCHLCSQSQKFHTSREQITKNGDTWLLICKERGENFVFVFFKKHLKKKCENTGTFLSKPVFGKCIYGEIQDLAANCLKFIHVYITCVWSLFSLLEVSPRRLNCSHPRETPVLSVLLCPSVSAFLFACFFLFCHCQTDPILIGHPKFSQLSRLLWGRIM
jgi:hypothetical protein